MADVKIPIHDHFDGSAHCVECSGPCRLTGAELAYTSLVRFMFEAQAIHHQTISRMVLWQMGVNGVNSKHFSERAAETSTTDRQALFGGNR